MELKCTNMIKKSAALFSKSFSELKKQVKFGEIHSGSRPDQIQESPSAKIHIFKLFSEQNAASADQNRADKSYTDTGAGLKQTAVIIRTEPGRKRFLFLHQQKGSFRNERKRRESFKNNRLSLRNLIRTRCDEGTLQCYKRGAEFQHRYNRTPDFTL